MKITLCHGGICRHHRAESLSVKKQVQLSERKDFLYYLVRLDASYRFLKKYSPSYINSFETPKSTPVFAEHILTYSYFCPQVF